MKWRHLLASALITVVALSTVSGATAAESRQRPSYPTGMLTVTYRQKAEGKLSPGFHILWLACSRTDCDLSTLTMNQCFGNGFYPKLQRSSTRAGDLKVTSSTNGVITLEERPPDLLGAGEDNYFRYRFTYDTVTGKDGVMFGDLRDFSGSVSKNSAVLKKVISWEMEPVRAPEGYGQITLDCTNVMVDGVPE